MEGASDVFGYPASDIDLRRPFGDRAEHLTVVDFLECLAVRHLATDLADQKDHRCRILERGVDADGSMAGAGTSRHQAEARLAGELAVSLGHIGRSGFVTGI